MTSQNNYPKTPCIGVCSTSIGDHVCRGCKRYAHEIILWNTYSDQQRSTVFQRLEALLALVVKQKVTIVDQQKLNRSIRYQGIRTTSPTNPYCWVFSVLKAGAGQINDFSEWGVLVKPTYENTSLTVLRDDIEKEFYTLSEAHYDRYFRALETV